ncbi:hemerythrin domain-containing protein [Sphingomonas sp. M1-B02]|uniref:hemerythrin domain-containing protein n=1 Tax=Sphingomonas sp. M1-B02 TaxID=3114300 RepID=UPI00223EF4DC|nr:hemerythrin domain-containing protein [Sphingomonas sp. S6-11]UZK66108.1 hemerythrin domain-containing protein [Sphingomonas sp. S6-11]
MSYERLIAEHDRIDDAVSQLLALVEVETPDVDAIIIDMAVLSCELSEHLAHEDSFIYPRMIAAQNTGMSDAAKRFVLEFSTLRADWVQYLAEWGRETILADWETFSAETRAMLARLAARISAENNLLYPAALREGAINLRS